MINSMLRGVTFTLTLMCEPVVKWQITCLSQHIRAVFQSASFTLPSFFKQRVLLKNVAQKRNVEPLGEKEVCLTVKLFEVLVTSNGSRGYSQSHNLAGSWISIAQMLHMWPYQRFSA